MTTTTALILNEIGGPFVLDQVKLDTIKDDEALIEIAATGICHTDLSCADGTLPASAPAVLGHEGMPQIEHESYLYLTVEQVLVSSSRLVRGSRILRLATRCFCHLPTVRRANNALQDTQPTAIPLCR